jgi:hypothetical protein
VGEGKKEGIGDLANIVAARSPSYIINLVIKNPEIRLIAFANILPKIRPFKVQ